MIKCVIQRIEFLMRGRVRKQGAAAMKSGVIIANSPLSLLPRPRATERFNESEAKKLFQKHDSLSVALSERLACWSPSFTAKADKARLAVSLVPSWEASSRAVINASMERSRRR